MTLSRAIPAQSIPTYIPISLTGLFCKGTGSYSVLPALTRLEQQGRDHLIHPAIELIYPGGMTPVPQPLVEEGISEPGRVSQQHPQRDGPLLVLQGPVHVQHLEGLELRAQALDLLPVVKVQPALLDELHAGDTGDGLGARGDPEDVAEGHIFRAGHPSSAGRVGKQLLAVLAYDYDGGARQSGTAVGAGGLDGGAEGVDGLFAEGGHPGKYFPVASAEVCCVSVAVLGDPGTIVLLSVMPSWFGPGPVGYLVRGD